MFGRSVLVADCKYKQTAPAEFRNQDVYQVLAYCTATRCDAGLLLYPRAELPAGDGSVRIANSNITIGQLTLDLGVPRQALDDECERFARSVFARAEGGLAGSGRRQLELTA